MAGKIQGADLKTEAELISAGATAAQLPKDSQIYVTANGINKTLDDAIIDEDIGGGGSGKNFITNGKANANTTGWATYADAAGALPVDGTGGSPTVTWSRSTTTPLSGVADFNFVKDAANRQGEGVAYAFSIDSANKSTLLSISFDYEVVSGTYATGDMGVYIYDVTNAAVIQPNAFEIENSSVNSKHVGCTFQTSATSTSYRLIFHVASTSTSAYTLAIDNVLVGPQINIFGALITDFVSFTPTGSWTNTTYTGRFSRIGDSAIIEYGLVLTGAPSGGNLTLNMPSGMTIDTAKQVSTIPNRDAAISGNATDTGTNNYRVVGFVNSSTVIGVRYLDTAANPVAVAPTAPFTWTTNDALQIVIRVPIVGWTANTVSSSAATTRSVVMTGTNASQALTANTTNLTLTTTKDSVGAWATNIYTVANPGDYDVSLAFGSASATTMVVYKNGSSFQTLDAVNNSSGGGTIIMPNLIVGDTISFRSSATVTVTNCYGSIALRQNNQTILASERISFVAHTSTTAATTAAPFIFTVEEEDTHGAYSTSTGIFTAPAPGLYTFGGSMVTTAATVYIDLYKNGTLKREGPQASNTLQSNFCHTFPLIAGDTVQVRPSANATGAGGSIVTSFWGFRVAGV